MTTHNVLVPSNFMANDEKSLDFVIQKYAHVKGVQITLFHTYSPVPEIEVRNNPLMERMSGNLSYLKQFLRDRENDLRKAKEKLVMGGFSSSQVHVIFTSLKNDVATDIITQVREKEFDIVVMNRNPSKIARFFTGSVSKKVSERLGSGVTVFILN